MNTRSKEAKNIIATLRRGGIGVLPTDTLYGLVGSALVPETIQRIYRVRRRNTKKPLIVLICSLGDLKRFGAVRTKSDQRMLRRVWPGPVSVILPVRKKEFAYLHRGTRAVAFRLPRPLWLRNLIKHTGPLVAPSANPEGKLPARTIAQARRYFETGVDFYVDGGTQKGSASALLRVAHGTVAVLREGKEFTRHML